jgi:5'-nucleotidase
VGRIKVLVVNDDTVTAAGLHALVAHLAATARCDVYVAAPDTERSGAAHCISIHSPINAEPHDIPGALQAFACGGTPADCTMIGVGVLYPGQGLSFPTQHEPCLTHKNTLHTRNTL